MDVARDHPVMLAFYEDQCPACGQMRAVVSELVRQNRTTGLSLTEVNQWEEPGVAVAHSVLTHPAMILFTDGRERTRIGGVVTKRRLLRRVLPYLYADVDRAEAELQRQLDSPGEQLERGRLRAPLLPRRDDQAEALRRVPLFGELNKRQRRMVARYCDEIQVAAGSLMTSEGEPGDELYVLVEGKAGASQQGRLVGRLEPGDYFGEMSVIDGGARTATVVAAEDCILLAMHRREFWAALEELPGVCERVLKTLSARLRAASQRSIQ